MFNKFHLLTFLSAFLIYSMSYGQKNVPLENGSIFWLNDGSKLIGKLVNDIQSTKQIEIITGDTISLRSDMVKKQYLSEDVSIYNNAKFHYKKGFLYNYSIGFANLHSNTDLSINKRFNNKFEIGFGLGFHYNELQFRTSSSRHWISVNSIPIFAQGKYIFNEGNKRFYVRGKIGYANNLDSGWGLTSLRNGVMLDGGFGITLPSKNRFKYYFELSQYTSSASGTLTNFEPNAISDIEFNTWYNRVVVTFGIEIGW